MYLIVSAISTNKHPQVVLTELRHSVASPKAQQELAVNQVRRSVQLHSSLKLMTAELDEDREGEQITRPGK